MMPVPNTLSVMSNFLCIYMKASKAVIIDMYCIYMYCIGQ